MTNTQYDLKQVTIQEYIIFFLVESVELCKIGVFILI